MLSFSLILHPTDFSTSSAYAFRLACSLARDHQARLVVLHVAETLGPELVSYGEAAAQLQPEAYQQKLWDELRQIRSSDPTIQIDYRLAEGDPASAIVRVASETGCNIIVAGTHGRTGLDRLLLGSVAEQVVRKAPCPVLTVKAPLSSAPSA